jgi:hypothetical protein
MRELRTYGSVGAGGGQPPSATRLTMVKIGKIGSLIVPRMSGSLDWQQALHSYEAMHRGREAPRDRTSNQKSSAFLRDLGGESFCALTEPRVEETSPIRKIRISTWRYD